MTTVYCKAKNGKIKEWSTWTEDNILIVQAGYIDGKKQQHSTEVIGKNIGKSNETTPSEQAVLESNSKLRKKLDQGYKFSIEELTDIKQDNDGFIKPMLASKDISKVIYPGYCQPKLDGVRGLAFISESINIRSRSGKQYNLPHIEEELKDLELNDTILDGEIFAKDLNFDKLISLVKDPKKENREQLEYWIYDIILPDNFKDRLMLLIKFDTLFKQSKYLKLCPTFRVSNSEELEKLHKQFLASNYEGTMYRNNEGLYEASYRSKDLIKIKEFFDEEYEIIGGTNGRGKFKNSCIFYLKTKDGKEFKCTAPGSIEQKEQTLTDLPNLIGKLLTVKYQEKTKDNIPRFPVGIAIRDYE